MREHVFDLAQIEGAPAESREAARDYETPTPRDLLDVSALERRRRRQAKSRRREILLSSVATIGLMLVFVVLLFGRGCVPGADD